MEYNGVDVSELQGNINWEKVDKNGIDFAMVRSTYDLSGIDSQFDKNMKEISKTKIHAGVYHQSGAQSVKEAVDEANYFLNTVKNYNLTYPLALKIESEFDIRKGKDFFSNIIVAFLSVIKENGYYPILYATIEMINNFIDLNRMTGFDLWLGDPLPEGTNAPNFRKNVTIWQNSQRGSVPGIAGNANLDISFVNYPEIIKQEGFKRISENISENNNLEPDFLEPSFYTVEKGDTLRSIAKKIFGDPEQYRRLMELNNLTRPIIFAGQTLRIPQNLASDTILYRVVQGDTLWKISERFLGYGPRYEEIMKINRLSSDMIYPGQVLKIPSEPQNNPSYYTVQEGDTLWKIAQKHYDNGNKYIDIMRANKLRNGNLRVGQVIIIPPKKSIM